MKYVVELRKVETDAIEVDAPTRDEALRAAEEHLPGFKTEAVVELNDAGDEKYTHEPIGKCESCNKVIWQGDDYAEDDDGVKICEPCYPKL